MSMELLFNYLEIADEYALIIFMLIIMAVACIAGLVFIVAIIGGILGWCGDKFRGV
jgi:hypothetical protein